MRQREQEETLSEYSIARAEGEKWEGQASGSEPVRRDGAQASQDHVPKLTDADVDSLLQLLELLGRGGCWSLMVAGEERGRKSKMDFALGVKGK